MKGLITKTFAVLLVVWYSMSIIGFDIHTCSGTGESFVVTFVEGLTCEDIHPEHQCAGHSCCADSHECRHHEEDIRIGAKSCCSSDYQVLVLTGTATGEKYGSDIHPSFVHSFDFPAMDLDLQMHGPYLNYNLLRAHSALGRMPDRQSVLSVWRI